MGKKFAPILISTVILLYLAMTLVGMADIPFGHLSLAQNTGVLLGLAVIVYLAGVMIITLVERLKEIDREDQDDLSKY